MWKLFLSCIVGTREWSMWLFVDSCFKCSTIANLFPSIFCQYISSCRAKSLPLSLPRSHLYFSSLSVIQFIWCYFGEFGIGSTMNTIIDIFLYSHPLSAWFCIDIVRRKSALVTHKNWMVNLSRNHINYVFCDFCMTCMWGVLSSQ